MDGINTKTLKRYKVMIEKIKYAIFDMDGTLIDSLGYWGYFWQKFGEKYFGTRDFKVDEDIDKQIRTITLKDASELLYERYKPDNSSADDILALANGMIEEHYGTRVSAKRGAVELLRYFKERGVKMCVASATEPRYVKYALEVQGIYGLFEFTVSCNEVGAGKDKPDVFLEAMKRLGGNLAESCVFEDSFIALETAKKAGFMTVGIYDEHNYCRERLKAASDFYVEKGKSLFSVAENTQL
ncbi:MAG: HAD family phosphatase [Ruminococcaceae bacterium]|nr:HAD family phosphatase [Oscillospiraceae bacterium]